MQIGLRQEAMDDDEDEEILCPIPSSEALSTKAPATDLEAPHCEMHFHS
jgi:hypothetical protein